MDGDFFVKNLKTYRPQWRLDANPLYVEPIHTNIEKAIDFYFETNSGSEVSDSIMWDSLKAVLHGKIIALTSAYGKEKRKLSEALLASSERLEAIHKQSCNPKIYRKLLEKRKKLEALETSKIQRRILYLNQKYWFRTPKSLKLLAWKVKSKQNATQIHAINNDEGVKQTLTSDILNVFVEYYTSLYSCSHPNLGNIQSF